MASYFGERLHVFCRRGAHTAAGAQVRALAPTFEDVFVRLAQKREAAA